MSNERDRKVPRKFYFTIDNIADKSMFKIDQIQCKRSRLEVE